MDRARIVVADDAAQSRRLIAAILTSEGYQVAVAANGGEALALVYQQLPDLVLARARMPGMDGWELCARLKGNADTRLLPVILMGAPTPGERLLAFQAGAVDFLGRPVGRQELLLRVGSLLRYQQLQGQVVEVEGVLAALAAAVEAKDPTYSGHIERMVNYARRLGERLGLGEAERQLLRRGAILHDVGKIAVPEAVLLKPAPLTAAEMAEMQRHPAVGAVLCRPLGEGVVWVVRHHHECYDGTGYPDRLVGEEIPLLARAMAVVDAYDALTSARPYRAAFSPQQAITVLQEGRGSQFDPYLVEAFIACL